VKNVIIATMAMLFLTACDPYEGILTVQEAFVVKSTDKNNDSVDSVIVPIGELKAKFEFPSKKEIIIKTKIDGKKRTLNLVLPKKLSIPENGSFSIAAADLGQEFGASGITESKIEEGPTRSGYQSCTYQRRETYCFTNPNGQVVCQDRWYTVNGQQYIEYHDRTTDQSISVRFEHDAVLANFQGQRSFSERVVHHQGQCF
jgi:hypothetical protein